MKQLLQVLEPAQQGAGSPDGTVILISLLRKWGRSAAVQGPDMPPEDMKAIFSSDLANAYGQTHRSALLKGLRLKAPQLAPFLGCKWMHGSNSTWCRHRSPEGDMS